MKKIAFLVISAGRHAWPQAAPRKAARTSALAELRSSSRSWPRPPPFRCTRPPPMARCSAIALCSRRPARFEANYGITYQNSIGYYVNPNNYKVLTRTQEISAAYVRSFVFKNFNPFVEAGPGGFIFLPIRNSGTTTSTSSSRLRSAASTAPASPMRSAPASTSALNTADGSPRFPLSAISPAHHQPLVQHLRSRQSAWPTTSNYCIADQDQRKGGPASRRSPFPSPKSSRIYSIQRLRFSLVPRLPVAPKLLDHAAVCSQRLQRPRPLLACRQSGSPHKKCTPMACRAPAAIRSWSGWCPARSAHSAPPPASRADSPAEKAMLSLFASASNSASPLAPHQKKARIVFRVVFNARPAESLRRRCAAAASLAMAAAWPSRSSTSCFTLPAVS